MIESEPTTINLGCVIYLPNGSRPVQVGGPADLVCDQIDRHPEAIGIAVFYNGAAGVVGDGDVERDRWFPTALLRAITNGSRNLHPDIGIPIWDPS